MKELKDDRALVRFNNFGLFEISGPLVEAVTAGNLQVGLTPNQASPSNPGGAAYTNTDCGLRNGTCPAVVNGVCGANTGCSFIDIPT